MLAIGRLGRRWQAGRHEIGDRHRRLEFRHLRHIGDARSRLDEAPPAIKFDQPTQRLEQGRLAAAVAANQADALAGADRQRYAGEGRPAAKADTGIAQC